MEVFSLGQWTCTAAAASSQVTVHRTPVQWTCDVGSDGVRVVQQRAARGRARPPVLDADARVSRQPPRCATLGETSPPARKVRTTLRPQPEPCHIYILTTIYHTYLLVRITYYFYLLTSMAFSLRREEATCPKNGILFKDSLFQRIKDFVSWYIHLSWLLCNFETDIDK